MVAVAVAVYRVLVLTHAAPTGSVLMVAHGSGGDAVAVAVIMLMAWDDSDGVEDEQD